MLNIQKDSRIEELEKQHQQSRLKVIELKDKNDNYESQINNYTSQLEIETNNRKRLENKIRSYSIHSAPDNGYDNDISGNNIGSSVLTSRSSLSRGGSRSHHVDRFVLNDDNDYNSESRQLNKRNNNNSNNTNNIENNYDYDKLTDDTSTYISFGNNRNNSLASDVSQMRSSSSLSNMHNQSQFTHHDVYKSPNHSPRSNNTNINNTFMQSPVDRVSIALASRAAAESSKSALKNAQQQKLLERQQQQQRTTSIPPLSMEGGSPDDNSKSNSAIEDTILRTQKLLNRRLGLNGNTSENNHNQQNNVDHMLPDSREKTPNSGRSVTKLNENITYANTLYPPEDPDAVIETPVLRPMSPPKDKRLSYSSSTAIDHLNKEEHLGGKNIKGRNKNDNQLPIIKKNHKQI